MKSQTETRSKGIAFVPRNRRAQRLALIMLLAVSLGAGFTFSPLSRLLSGSASAQQDDKPQITREAMRQIEALIKEKESRTPDQQKIDSQLLYKLRQKRGQSAAPGVRSLIVGVEEDNDGRVLLDIRAKVTREVVESIKLYGGEIVSAHRQFNAIRAKLPLDALETIASLSEVSFIRPAEEPMIGGNSANTLMTKGGTKIIAPVTRRPSRAERQARVREQLTKLLPLIANRKNSNSNSTSSTRNYFPALTGSLNSEGDVAHRADQVRALGINGNGIRIGVMSDSVRFLAQSQMTGDLPAVTVLAGQSGVMADNSDTGEGTAMLEIVNDLTPGAQLFFATAFGGQANMAANILALAGNPNNCDIIVDDVSYFSEGVFQDDNIAQAVNTVTAAGVIYFSSAGNSGNLNDGTSGVWEGDFNDGGTLAAVPGGRVHDFGGGVIANTINATGGGTRPIVLKWSDPLNGSNNDYDLFILNAALTTVIASSTNSQTGSQDPLESISNNTMTPVFAAGNRIVILRRTGSATRALHLNTNRGRLAIGTAGQTYGHNAAGSAFGVAQVDVRITGGGVFTGGAANPVRTTSSDGPRRIFYTPAGAAITPGNVLFGTGGGQLLQKPDIAAAACGVTTVPGFNPFCGTSAAAPHAAALAALLLDFDNTLTPAQVRTALTSTALDIEAPGVDRDSGAGIVMGLQSLSAVSSADLSITKTDSPDPVVAGTNLTYTINIGNSGAGPATFVQWQDALPAGTRFQSLSAPSSWNCTTPPVGSGGSITCTKDSMAVSESASFTLVVRVDAAVADGTILSNTATVSASSGDPNGANNSATATTAVIAQADLELLAKVDAPDPVVTNNPLTYTITLRNNGPSVAANATLNDSLPIGALFNNCSATSGGVCGGAGQNRNVTFASLAVGATATVTFETTANCILADGAIINNTATISAVTTDPNPANNSASAMTIAQNPPPVITCPPDQDVIALTPGSTTAIVNFPAPVVVDNCPGSTVVCVPASGSAFPLGTTAVTCTATDSGGAMASCGFNVTVWDAAIQDDASGDYLLFNTFTGDYKFVHCGVDMFTMIGRGEISRVGCVVSLHDDTRVNASFDRCNIAPKNTGGAFIKRMQPDTTFVLKDRNILNNSPTCP
ncbi:MAG: S8 family serine peptidase [Blastocatellales bacterium]